MKHFDIPTAAAALLLGFSTAAMAQTSAMPAAPVITTPIAPGAGSVDLGGIGSANIPVAPGAATLPGGGAERIGSGGIPLAPGLAGTGSLSRTPLVTTPALPQVR